MNRIDLLKRVAEVAPEWMGAEVTTGAFLGKTWHEVEFSLSEDYAPTLSLENDYSDAPAIVAMLNEIQKKGLRVVLQMGRNEGYECLVSKISPLRPVPFKGSGSTRAEAVALAFVAVFGGKE